jgi:hypothetical protein
LRWQMRTFSLETVKWIATLRKEAWMGE